MDYQGRRALEGVVLEADVRKHSNGHQPLAQLYPRQWPSRLCRDSTMMRLDHFQGDSYGGGRNIFNSTSSSITPTNICNGSVLSTHG